MGNLSSGLGNSSYYDLARQGRIFTAFASLTAPVIYSTAAGTGGPLLWNNSVALGRAVNAVLLGISCSITTTSGAAAGLGITGNTGQTSAPTSTTAIAASGNGLVGGPSALCNVYKLGTVANAGNFFMPFLQIGTGVLTTDTVDECWVPIDGAIIVPPGAWASVAGSITITTMVATIGLMWAEIPA